jgi:hypothetical protein
VIHPVTGLLLLDECPDQDTNIHCPHCGAVDTWTVHYTDMGAVQKCDGGNSFDSYDVVEETFNIRYATCGECDVLVWYDPQYFLFPGQVTAMAKVLERTFTTHAATVAISALKDRCLSNLDWTLPEEVAKRNADWAAMCERIGQRNTP